MTVASEGKRNCERAYCTAERMLPSTKQICAGSMTRVSETTICLAPGVKPGEMMLTNCGAKISPRITTVVSSSPMNVTTVENTCQASSSCPSVTYLVKTGMKMTLSEAPATR